MKNFWDSKTFEVSDFEKTLENRKQIYNEYGFRADSINKDGFKIMSIGCSLTEGVGVEQNETWPAQFCEMIPNSVNLNFGLGGRSNDYISRTILTYTEVLKPALVLVMYTYPHRREYFRETGEIEPFHPTPWGYFDENMEGRKNFLRCFCCQETKM